MPAAPVPPSTRERGPWPVALVACLLLASTASGQSSPEIERVFDLPPRLAAFLRGPASLSYGDLVRLRRGEVVTRPLERRSDRGAAFISVTAVEATTPERFRRGAVDGDLLLDRPDVLAWGRFAEPPDPVDLDGLTLDDEDFAALSDCRVGDCKIKLAADGIRELRAGVEFGSADARSRATELLRRDLFQRLVRYRQVGDGGLGRYDDKEYSLTLGEEAVDLVRESPFLSRHSPALRDYLLVYPRGRLPEAVDVFFWSKEDHGTRRHVTSLEHGVVWAPPAGDEADILVVTKQLYANHYFEGALAITLLVPTPSGRTPADAAGTDGGDAPGGRRAWLVHVYRCRLDVLRGFGLFHGRVRSGVWHQVDGRMRQWRDWLQSGAEGR